MPKPFEPVQAYPFPIKKPLIGVMTCPLGGSGKHIPTIKRKAFRELILVSRMAGTMVFVFEPDAVNWDTKSVTGSTLIKINKKYQWKDYRFNLPDIVYNRIPNRLMEKLESVEKAKRNLDYFHIPYFNPCYLDKWSSYRWLSADSRLADHLPETRVLDGSTLEDMINRHGSVYIKLIAGSLGKGIVRINAFGKKYVVTKKTDKGFESIMMNNLETVLKLYHADHLSRYIVQKSIDLAKYQNRIFDLRTLVQKNREGIWQLTGVAVRSASENAHVTHVPNGGKAVPLNKVLYKLLDNNAHKVKTVYRQIVDFAETVPKALERASGLKFGEISLDIGIDKEMNIWLIEINSKPFRFDERDIRILSRKRIVEYATYLNLKEGEGSEKP